MAVLSKKCLQMPLVKSSAQDTNRKDLQRSRGKQVGCRQHWSPQDELPELTDEFGKTKSHARAPSPDLGVLPPQEQAGGTAGSCVPHHPTDSRHGSPASTPPHGCPRDASSFLQRAEPPPGWSSPLLHGCCGARAGALGSTSLQSRSAASRRAPQCHCARCL